MCLRSTINFRQIFQKSNISYPLKHTRTCAYQNGKKCLVFGKKRFMFLYSLCFDISPVVLPALYQYT